MAVRRMLLVAGILLLPACLPAQETRFPPQNALIPGPAKPSDFHDWLRDLKQWRRDYLIRIAYDDSEYARPELQWTESSFIQPQMMIHDRYFYDPVEGKYTVDRYLDDLEERYGGIDSVLVWHTYPNLGIDDRNQYDFLRAMPGGLAGAKRMVSDFHRRGVRVLFPVMMWDQGTRDEGIPDWLEMPRLMAELDADGINGDTLFALPRAFRTASDKSRHPIALEPQLAPQRQLFPQDVWEALAWNNLSWGDWVVPRELDDWKYPFIPLVSEYKWLESRHMVHVSDRWERDKTDDLQHAFFNGIGYESWENIFGIWNQINPRDGEALRRISAIERAFAKLLGTPAWEPHTPTLRQGVFASKFPGDDETLWTLVNRNEYEVAGKQIEVAYESGMHYYDVWRGEELKPELLGEQAILSIEIAPHGFGAIWATRSEPTSARQVFLNRMRQFAHKRLTDFPHEWHFLSQELVEIPRTQPESSPRAGMVLIPGGVYEFKVSGVEIEGGDEIGVDVQFPWENSPRRHHLKTMAMKPFFIDRYPVTHQNFKMFLDATHYRPKDDHNFLRDWKDGTYPEGWGNKPVTWVSLEDARAYAVWAGKRLPHEWEWQYAAQGTDGRLYPWGNVWEPQAVPPPVNARNLGGPSDVDPHPQGASPFGVMDLVGNVWQWTDEYRDAHTRAAILRGGSTYQPQGSRWYFPQAFRLTEHGKYLLMAPSIDRSGTIGFRCVVDAETRAADR